MRFPWTAKVEQREAEAFERGRKAAQSEIGEAMRLAITVSPEAQGNKPPTQTPLYAFDNPWRFNVLQSPRKRPDSTIDVDTLRRFADTYDIARSCINHLKREVAAVPIKVAPRDEDAKSAARIREAQALFEPDGPIGGRSTRRSHFESTIIEDVCVIGAAAVYHHPTIGGGIFESYAIDAATIRPRTDAFGWPGPGEEVYEQYVQGLLVRGFTRDELTYDGIFPVSNSPYFRSPVEWLLGVVVSALKADEWNRAWLIDGNSVNQMVALPETWTPEQVMTFQAYYDSLTTGRSHERQKTKFVPSGTSTLMNPSRKDQDFQEFELWLLRRTCAIFGVAPSSIGFAGEQYKVSQENSNRNTTQFGAGALLDFRAELYNDLLRRMGYGDLMVVNVPEVVEDPDSKTDRLVKSTGGAFQTVNEARAEAGLNPIEGGDELRQGPMPVGSDPEADKPSDEDDPETDLNRWRRKAIGRLKAGKPALCEFESKTLSEHIRAQVRTALADCQTAEQVARAFGAIQL